METTRGLKVFLVTLFSLMCLRCGVASKTPFLPEEDRVTFNKAVGQWEHSTSSRYDKITLEEYAERSRERSKKKPSLTIGRAPGRNYWFEVCEDPHGCDNFALRFIRRGETTYASFRAVPNGAPKTTFGKAYAPDLYGVAKIEAATECMIRFRFIGRPGGLPPTLLRLITKHETPHRFNQLLTAEPERVLAETERLDQWAEQPFEIFNTDKGMCDPLFGVAPGWFLSPGASFAFRSWKKGDARGFTLGGEVSASYFHGGGLGLGYWTGGYLDLLYDTGTRSARGSIGPQAGLGPLGFDGGYTIDLSSGAIRHGAQVRGIVSFSVMQLFMRLSYLQGYGTDWGNGVLIKVPLRLTNDAKLP